MRGRDAESRRCSEETTRATITINGRADGQRGAALGQRDRADGRRGASMVRREVRSMTSAPGSLQTPMTMMNLSEADDDPSKTANV